MPVSKKMRFAFMGNNGFPFFVGKNRAGRERKEAAVNLRRR